MWRSGVGGVGGGHQRPRERTETERKEDKRLRARKGGTEMDAEMAKLSRQ